MSVSREPSAAPPAAPLYDTLADHRAGGAPIIPQTGQSYTNSTRITLLPPLYYRPHDLHYTLDGSKPTVSSPVYDGPFFATDTVHIAVRQIDASGNPGPIAREVVTIHDQTPPRLVSVLTDQKLNALDLAFSKPLAPATASDPGNYTIQPPVAINKISPTQDGQNVVITFDARLIPGIAYTVTLQGIRDSSPQANPMEPASRTFNAGNIVYSLASVELPAGVTASVPDLPAGKADSWTMNLFVKATAKPADKTIIAGFGQNSDGPDAGGARYFAVFPDGIRFWSSGRDVITNSPLDLGRWQMLTATYDGKTLAIYKDGQPIMQKEVEFAADSEASVSVGTADPWDHQRRFQGRIRNFTIRRGTLNGDEVKQLFEAAKPDQ